MNAGGVICASFAVTQTGKAGSSGGEGGGMAIVSIEASITRITFGAGATIVNATGGALGSIFKVSV